MEEDRHEGVWEDETDPEFLWTDYPPPEGFDGEEAGRYGDFGYRRELTGDEAVAYRGAVDEELAEERAAGEAQRLAYFFGGDVMDDDGAEESADDAANEIAEVGVAEVEDDPE